MTDPLRTSKLGDEIRSAYDEKEWSGGAMLGWADDVDALLAVVPALEDADAWLDAMAIAGIRGWLKPGEQSPYASVHTKIREALAALPEHLK